MTRRRFDRLLKAPSIGWGRPFGWSEWLARVVSRPYDSTMTSPFRYNKKQRKNYRKRVKAQLKAADKAEDPQSEATLRTLVDINSRISLAKRRK